MSRLAVFLLFILATEGYAQDSLKVADSTRVLDEVVVSAYQSNRPIEEVPAAIGVVDARLMNRFANSSFVSATNTIPGVRMEERSPGSYRFSIRGSLLRSPFGVRNVKFYWRGLPFTDGGGNTYLNLLDFSSVSNMEIIKGPGSSLYGAGTGGVVLMRPTQPTVQPFRVRAGLMGGSYGLAQMMGDIGVGTEKSFVRVYGGFQASQGYREQTAMSRLNGTFEYSHFEATSAFHAVIFAGSLYYQTPGGLTLAQYQEDPSQARPATQFAPGAVQQKASIRNKPLYAALSYEKDFGDRLSASIGVYGSWIDFINPAILNYEQRDERNIGTRISADYFFGKDQKQKLTFGGEAQHFSSAVEVSANVLGNKDVLRTQDDLKSNSMFTFMQADFQLPYDFFFTLGGSVNFLTYNMVRTTPVEDEQKKDFEPGFFPRVALLKKFYDVLSAYATVSQGFSAPSFAEVLPNTGVYNSDLNPEQGINFEVGLKADFMGRKLHGEVSLYDFRLNDAIVNVSGGDDFQNAGETSQKGFEGAIYWLPITNPTGLRLWVSYSYNNYHFVDYTRSGTDYSNNELTGVPRQVVVGGVDLTTRHGWYMNATVNHTAQIPVNDANSEYAREYTLVGARLGKRGELRKGLLSGARYEFFTGIDNALNQTYSLGNDLNAAGGRYYNAAPKRNYYLGVLFPVGK